MSDLTNDREDLSALIDGELSPAREAELRARIDANPELAAQLAALVAIDEELRALPAAVVPQQLQASLRRRIDAEGRRSRASWVGVGIGAALAASLSVYLLVPSDSFVPSSDVVTQLEMATDEEIGIALEYDTLADLEVIEELEVLELMAERG